MNEEINKEEFKKEEDFIPVKKKKVSQVTSMKFSTIQLPYFEERVGKEYTTWGGDNLYPDFLVQLYHRCAMHRRCIDAKVDAALGKGLILNIEDRTILEEANPKETWNEVFEKCLKDYVLFGGFAINVIWDETGTEIVEFYHLDLSKVRTGKLNDDDEVHQYWYSQNWAIPKKYKPKPFTTFSQRTAFEAAEAAEKLKKDSPEQIAMLEHLSQIMFVKDYNSTYMYYPTPDYDGAISDIQLDINISSYHISNIANGITPSFHINFPSGIPTLEGQAKLYEELSSNYSGSQNAGRMMITFSDGKEKEPTITPLKADNDNYYKDMQDRILNTLVAAHSITSPLLIGIRDSTGGLGNNKDEIETSWLRFLFTTIRPIQKVILKAFNRILDSYGHGYENLILSVEPEVVFTNDQISTDNTTSTDTNVTTTGNTKSSDSITTKPNV